MQVNENKPKIEVLTGLLTNIGIIISIITSVVYLFIVYILIAGFEADHQQNVLEVFVVLGGIVGISISLSFRSQGVTYAKNTDEAKKQLKEYRDLKGKSKNTKIYPIWIWFTTNAIKDILFKGVSVGLTIYYSISLVYEGIKDYTYFFLAITNVLMFVGFGMMSLAGGYSRYINYQIPYIQQKIEKLKKEKQNDLPREIESSDGQSI